MVGEIVEKTMRKGVRNIAATVGKQPNEVQILILLQGERVVYKRMTQGAPNEEVEFKDIIGKKWDMMNREAICQEFIPKALDKFAKIKDCPVHELFVVVSLVQEKEDETLQMLLYRNSAFLQKIEVDELFQ